MTLDFFACLFQVTYRERYDTSNQNKRACSVINVDAVLCKLADSIKIDFKVIFFIVKNLDPWLHEGANRLRSL